MSHIVTITFSTGIIPDGMNTYKSHSTLNPDGIKIIPIFKSGDAFSLSNYRSYAFCQLPFRNNEKNYAY